MLLLISDRRELRASLAAALTRRGIFLWDVPLESAAHVSHQRDTGGVLLDTVGNPQGAAQLFSLLRERYPALPIAILAAPGQIVSLLADAILREGPIEETTDATEEFYRKGCGWQGETLSSHALAIGAEGEACRYLGYSLSLSPLERRILACLFYRSPRYTSPEELLELCFPSTAHRIQNVAVQIGRINRAAAHIDPRPLIVNRYGVGYRLREGILDTPPHHTTEVLQAL